MTSQSPRPIPLPTVGPLGLQNHGDAVRYRNVWARAWQSPDANPLQAFSNR